MKIWSKTVDMSGHYIHKRCGSINENAVANDITLAYKVSGRMGRNVVPARGKLGSLDKV
jgi:hypothetical protein